MNTGIPTNYFQEFYNDVYLSDKNYSDPAETLLQRCYNFIEQEVQGQKDAIKQLLEQVFIPHMITPAAMLSVCHIPGTSGTGAFIHYSFTILLFNYLLLLVIINNNYYCVRYTIVHSHMYYAFALHRKT